MKIPLYNPPELSGKYLRRVLSAKHLTTGPLVKELQERVAFLWGVKPERVVLANSATACFQAIVDLEGAGKVDWRPKETWPLLPEIAETAAPGPEMVVFTDIGGRCEIPGVVGTQVVVHDCCHSWMPDRRVDYAFASFYPTKLVPGAEGGVLVAGSEEKARMLRVLVNCGFGGNVHGRTRDWTRARGGRKANMTDVAAALNLEALELYEWGKTSIFREYEEMMEELKKRGLDLMVKHQPIKAYLLQVRVKNVPRARKWFEERGVGTGWNFPPSKWLTLPCWNGMTSVQIWYIAELLEEYYGSVDGEEA